MRVLELEEFVPMFARVTCAAGVCRLVKPGNAICCNANLLISEGSKVSAMKYTFVRIVP